MCVNLIYGACVDLTYEPWYKGYMYVIVSYADQYHLPLIFQLTVAHPQYITGQVSRHRASPSLGDSSWSI